MLSSANGAGRRLRPHPMISAPAVLICLPSPGGLGGMGDFDKDNAGEEGPDMERFKWDDRALRRGGTHADIRTQGSESELFCVNLNTSDLRY